MIETLLALVLAHVLAEFLLAPPGAASPHRTWNGQGLHGLILGLCACLALGRLHPALIWLVAIHLAIDLALDRAPGDGPRPHRLTRFLAAQAAHLAVLFSLALWLPHLWHQGLWQDIQALPALYALAGGLILATRAGGQAIGLLMEPFRHASPDGLPGGGRVIGLLERGMILLLVLLDQPEGIGLLIAAKSVLRFNALRDDRAASEYVIIGTLASFAWAMVVAALTSAALGMLPPLGKTIFTP